MKHVGDLIQTGLLGMLDQEGRQDFPHQTMSFSMGGPAPAVSYLSGNREWSVAMPQTAQSALGVTAPMVANAVWNPEAGKGNPAALPAVWDTSRQDAYPIRNVVLQEGDAEALSRIPTGHFYQIGRRYLKGLQNFFPAMPEAQEDVNSRFEHHHLWREDGVNFGLTTTGKFSEQGGRERYSFDVPGHDETRYKAEYIEQAVKELDQEWEEVERILRGAKDDMPMSDDIDDEMPRYHAFRYNCQDFVDSVIERAWKKAQMNNDTLIF